MCVNVLKLVCVTWHSSSCVGSGKGPSFLFNFQPRSYLCLNTLPSNFRTMAVTNPYSRQTSTTSTTTATTASASSPPSISASLTRQLLQLHHPNQRFTNDAIMASSELLRLLIIEARRRAAIEAECESEVYMGQSQNSDNDMRRVEIRAEHVAKIAAELLMDLS